MNMNHLSGSTTITKLHTWMNNLLRGAINQRLVASLLLLLFYALALTSIGGKTPTFDEQGFLTRGLGYLRRENTHMRVGHPLGMNALSASLLVSDQTVQLPTQDPSWQKPNFHRPSELFMWEIGNDVAHVIFLARLPTIWLGMILLAVVGRWGFALTKRPLPALFAMTLLALDPNIIAHSRLATTDIGLTFGATIAGFGLWHWLKRPSIPHAIFAGAGFALLQNSKFTAGLFVPLFTAVIVVGIIHHWRVQQTFPRALIMQLICIYPLAGFLALWAMYGFQIGTLPDNLPTLSQLSGVTLPLSHHLEQLLDIGGRLQKSTPAFLWGQYSDHGWWYYFPIAFALKTPLPTLVLLVGTLGYGLWRRQGAWLDWAILLVPPVGYFAIALTTDINLGVRHLLPTLPYFILFIAWKLHEWQHGQTSKQYLLGLPVLGLLFANITIYPHYLSTFNLLAGGANNGWHYLVDSNIDWGQDLGALDEWMAKHGVEHVWLSYFGEGRPDYYGITYTGLDSVPPRLMNPLARPFLPQNPTAGIYAISVSNLQGVAFANHDQFAWFRQQEPIAKIGYSIFIYEVKLTGHPVDVVLSGTQLDRLPPEQTRFGSNQLTPHWLTEPTALIVPNNMNSWLLIDEQIDPALHEELEAYWGQETNGRYARTTTPRPTPSSLTTFQQDGSQMRLYASPSVAQENGQLVLVTHWQQQGEANRTTKLFIHVTDETEEIVSQWDGFTPVELQPNAQLWQVHRLPLPDNYTPQTHQIWLGVYNSETGVRWEGAGLVNGRLLLP